MKNANSPAHGEAMPKDPLAPRGPMSCEIDMASLRNLSMQALHDLRTSLRTLNDIAAGIGCQPRFWNYEEQDTNQAGKLIDTICEWLLGYEQAVVNVGTAAEPQDPSEVEMRGWLIVGFEADLSDNLDGLAVTVAQAVKGEADARFRQRNSRGVGQ